MAKISRPTSEMAMLQRFSYLTSLHITRRFICFLRFRAQHLPHVSV